MEIDRRLFLFAFTAPLYAAAPLSTFSKSEAFLIEALIDQVIPADDTPGAREAGVLYYLDQQLAGPLKRFAVEYHAGLVALERTGFSKLGFEARTAYLVNLGVANEPEIHSFFRLVTEHTMQGFYGSPKYGGNKDETSWKVLGITDLMGGHVH